MPPIDAPDEVVLTLPAAPEFVRLARLTCAGLATRIGMGYDEVEDLRIAVGEACSLLIGAGARKGTLTLTFGLDADAARRHHRRRVRRARRRRRRQRPVRPDPRRRRRRARGRPGARTGCGSPSATRPGAAGGGRAGVTRAPTARSRSRVRRATEPSAHRRASHQAGVAREARR